MSQISNSECSERSTDLTTDPGDTQSLYKPPVASKSQNSTIPARSQPKRAATQSQLLFGINNDGLGINKRIRTSESSPEHSPNPSLSSFVNHEIILGSEDAQSPPVFIFEIDEENNDNDIELASSPPARLPYCNNRDESRHRARNKESWVWKWGRRVEINGVPRWKCEICENLFSFIEAYH
jgi:hypothetical protein